MSLDRDLDIIRRALFSGQISGLKVDAQRALARVQERTAGRPQERLIGVTEGGRAVYGLARNPKAGHYAEALEAATAFVNVCKLAAPYLERIGNHLDAQEAADVDLSHKVALAADCLSQAQEWAADIVLAIERLRGWK